MWSRTVILGVIFCYCQVGGEISDVTTIYDLGLAKSKAEVSLNTKETITDDLSELDWIPDREVLRVHETRCINGVVGRVHSRTNALGSGLLNEEYQYFEYKNPELPNITCDINFVNEGVCSEWDSIFLNNWIVLDKPGYQEIPFENGTAYRIPKNLVLNMQNIKNDIYLLFTRGSDNLRNEKVYFVILFYKNYNNIPNIFYDCKSQHGYYQFSILDRDTQPTTIYCQALYAGFSISNPDYLTFNFTDGEVKRVQIERGRSRKYTSIDWSYGTDLDINYFSISTTDARDAKSATLGVKAFDLTNEWDGMVSPIFTPQSENLCLTVVFHSTIPFMPSLDIYVLGLLSNGNGLLHTVNSYKNGWNVKRVNISLENLNPIKLRVSKSSSEKIMIARIASCNPDGEEVFELPSSISVCSNDHRIRSWGSEKSSLRLYTSSAEILDSVENITDTKHQCWNGGVLTSAGCACTPGFSGSNCHFGCGRNRFGQDCEGLCSFHSEECRGLLLCNRFTGCRCAPGYRGEDCTEACSRGWYGNDCSERCGHCAGDTTCDIYTGECTSCEDGYLAPHCKIASVYYGSKPEVTSPSYGTVVVSFDPNNYISSTGPPQLYQIQVREKGDQWKVYTSKSLQKSSEDSEKEMKISEKIEGLKTGTLYQVRVLFIDAYFLKYDGDLVQVAEILTKCDIPSSYDYKVAATTNSTAVTFSWKYVPEDQHWCPLETFEVSWREGWKKQTMFTKDNFILSSLGSGLAIRFNVRAKTSGGFAPYSKTVKATTQKSELPAVQKLGVESSQSTSVEIVWEPPRGSGDNQLRYTISYKCMDRPACFAGCQNVSEGQLTQEGTSVTLSPLLPFTKYLVTVSAEGGAKSSIYVGTTKVVPTEVPTLSAQKPVRTNTSVTVYWDQGPVCTGYLLGYNYQLTKASDPLKILASEFTKDTSASFHNLTASTEYVVKVFVSTVAGWNPLSYLAINISTSATVPEAVRNLVVYKKGRGMLGLRWAEPRATYGQLKSFTITHSLGQEFTTHTVEPLHCVVWPDLYCHTIEGLRSNRRYNVSVSARNSEVAEDGELSFVSAVTKESPPSAPVNLKVTNSSSTSIELGWNYPELANGIVRSFLISVEETEKYDQDSCCQIYPFVETSVKEELETYSSEVSGLHPASTYFVSVSAKTVGLGPSQSLVAYTRPPHLPLTSLPRVEVPEVSWLSQDKLPEFNNSEVYTSLIKTHLLLAVLNEGQPIEVPSESGITDPKLDSLLQQKIGKPFYFIAEYSTDDVVDLSGPLEDSDSAWGRPPVSLSPVVSYQLVAIQVLEYNSVYNVDLRYSKPFTLPL